MAAEGRGLGSRRIHVGEAWGVSSAYRPGRPAPVADARPLLGSVRPRTVRRALHTDHVLRGSGRGTELGWSSPLQGRVRTRGDHKQGTHPTAADAYSAQRIIYPTG